MHKSIKKNVDQIVNTKFLSQIWSNFNILNKFLEKFNPILSKLESVKIIN